MKRYRDMTVVITGAASGIGLATAYAFAARGATIVAAGRQGDALDKLAKDCRERVGRALAVPTDTTREEDVQALARRAVESFGRIDVWINNAAVTAFGRFEDVPPDIFRRVIDTNFFGYVSGARAALPIFREQGSGVLINVASLVAYVAQPYASAYVCSKHAVRALGDCLRMELALDDAPDIHVCTVLPATIDTPLFQHGANFMGRAAQAMPPVYEPEAVAQAIVRLAKRPQREVFIGNAGRVMAAFRAIAPAAFERVAARQVDRHHFQDRPAPQNTGNLFSPASSDLDLHGGWKTGQRGPSMAIAAAGLALVVPMLVGRLRRGRRRPHVRHLLAR